MKETIKAILKGFYKSRNTEAHCQLISHCVPDIPSEHVSAVLKEFAAGEYNLETLEASAEKILAYKPEPKKKDRYQISEES